MSSHSYTLILLFSYIITMLLLFFKTAFRNLFGNRSFAAINIFGLAVGMAVFLLITQYVRFENSYENFIPNRENI